MVQLENETQFYTRYVFTFHIYTLYVVLYNTCFDWNGTVQRFWYENKTWNLQTAVLNQTMIYCEKLFQISDKGSYLNIYLE